MQDLGMIGGKGVTKPKVRPVLCRASHWLRSPAGGLLRMFRQSGDTVAPGEVIGMVSDPFGENETQIVAERGGIIVGRSNLPVVNEGDALFHVAELPDPSEAAAKIGALAGQVEAQPLFDEDEII
jgi:predicted deacylase